MWVRSGHTPAQILPQRRAHVLTLAFEALRLSGLTCPLVAHFVLAVPASLLFLKSARHTPTSSPPLPLPFPLQAMLFLLPLYQAFSPRPSLTLLPPPPALTLSNHLCHIYHHHTSLLRVSVFSTTMLRSIRGTLFWRGSVHC